jgi:hypothetical protein
MLFCGEVGAVPSQVLYLGHLEHESGAPFTGTLDVEVRLFPSANSQGAPLWSQNTSDLPVFNGVFSLILGQENNGTLAAILGSSNQLWLEFVLDEVPMEPRQQILSVPAALHCQNAAELDGHTAEDFVLAAPNGDVEVAGELDSAGKITAPLVQLAGNGGVCGPAGEGSLRYNATTKTLELCDGAAWQNVGLVDAAALSLDAATLTVGAITGGVSPGACTPLPVTNVGGVAAIAPALAAFTGANPAAFQSCAPAANPCGTALAAGATCNFGVRLVATSNGTFNAIATVQANGGASASRNVTGTATGFVASLTWTGSGAGMNVTAPSTTGAPVSFTLTNVGTAPSASLAGTIGITGPQAANFTIQSNSCAGALAVGGSCSVVVVPTANSNGSYSAALGTTAHNAPSTALSGTASGFGPPTASCPGASVVQAGRCVWTSPSTSHQFVVPTGVSSITVKAWGGGGGGSQDGGQGAGGGFVRGTVGVSAGQSFTVVVASGGGSSSMASQADGPGGTPGGGNGKPRLNYSCSAGGGGGLSGVFAPTFTHANAWFVAGGGGGTGTCGNTPGGPGGGTTGGTPHNRGDNPPAGPGTQNNGGGGAPGGGQSGGPLFGGNAASGGHGGGGGGAGYYGGGGGANCGSGGAGGSSFAISGATAVQNLSGGSGNPESNVHLAGGSSDADYAPGVAVGGPSCSAGGPGRVVITW